MEERKITQSERGCMGECINKHWGGEHSSESADARDRSYEACLEDCQVCG